VKGCDAAERSRRIFFLLLMVKRHVAIGSAFGVACDQIRVTAQATAMRVVNGSPN